MKSGGKSFGKPPELHDWDLTPREAIAVQRTLREQIRTDLQIVNPRMIAGVDVAYDKPTGQSIATVALLEYPELRLAGSATVRMETPFPYVPGLLSFRELPPILQAFQKIETAVDLIFVDGHGQAHPRQMGIASHLGLWLRLPTIGIGKSRLCGAYEEPGPAKGDCSDLVYQNRLVGRVLRTRTGVRPIFVSVGYGLPLEDCIRWALAVTPRYRLPEPIRFADRLAGEAKKVK
ncbi:MAG: endonuclease V [Acidobacteriota bacterium]|nr:MAG: endonuclease V [Acidobacteriota bacterium]